MPVLARGTDVPALASSSTDVLKCEHVHATLESNLVHILPPLKGDSTPVLCTARACQTYEDPFFAFSSSSSLPAASTSQQRPEQTSDGIPTNLEHITKQRNYQKSIKMA